MAHAYSTAASLALRIGGVAALVLAGAAPLLAGEADVVAVHAHRRGPSSYDLSVTVRSRDTGWARYADRLEAVAPDGTILGSRTLDHPHEDEQPFTRDIGDVTVTGSTKVTVRVHFKPTGFDGVTATVALPKDAS